MEYLDPELLRIWAKVAQAGNLKTVSQQLFVSQPALSHQMKRLQDWLQEPLYQRASHGIQPTEMGRRMQRIGEQIEELMAEAKLIRNHSQELIIGDLKILASHTNAEFLLPQLIGQFHQNYPSVNIELATMNSREAWRQRNQADLVFIENSQELVKPPAEWQLDTLIDTEIVLLVRPDHSFGQREVIELSELQNEVIVWREEGSGIREHAMQALLLAGYYPEIRYAFNGLSAVRDAVRCGLGVAFASALISPYQTHDLAVIRLLPTIPHNLSMIYRDHVGPAPSAFIAETHALLLQQRGA